MEANEENEEMINFSENDYKIEDYSYQESSKFNVMSIVNAMSTDAKSGGNTTSVSLKTRKPSLPSIYTMTQCLVAMIGLSLVLISLFIYQMTRISDIEEKLLTLDRLTRDHDWIKSQFKDLEDKTTKENTRIDTEINDLKKDTRSSISTLKLKDEELMSEVSNLNHTEKGTISFKSEVLESLSGIWLLVAQKGFSRHLLRTVTFHTAYDTPPKVFLSVNHIESHKHGDDTWYQVHVTNITTSGFTVNASAVRYGRCLLYVDWFSFPVY